MLGQRQGGRRDVLRPQRPQGCQAYEGSVHRERQEGDYVSEMRVITHRYEITETLNKRIMKNLKFVFSVLAVVFIGSLALISCGDEIGDEPVNVKDCIGTWMCIQSTDNAFGKSVDGLLVGKEITLNENGTFTSTAASIGTSGVWTLNGNEATAKSDAGTFILKIAVSGSTMKWEGTANNGVKFKYTFRKE